MLDFAFELLKAKELKELVQVGDFGCFELVTDLL